jgi:hypothetical protein
MQDAEAVKRVGAIYEALMPVMDERMRRQWVAAEAQAYGWGGVRLVGAAIHMSANTNGKGIRERATREADQEPQSNRLRREGGGRKKQIEVDAGLQAALEKLIDPATRGDPQSPLRWTCKEGF